MEEESKYSLLEFGLSFLLLFSVISLLRGVLSFYGLCLIFGLIIGFCFSWFFRVKQNKILKILPTIGALGVFAWIIYSMLDSSFFYKDLILICVKGLLAMELICSFFARTPPFLTYLQSLSLVLFMSHPIFINRNYNEVIIVSTIVYFITWFAILKVKFYETFSFLGAEKTKQYYSVSVSGIFILIILVFSGLLFATFPFGESRKYGVLPEESSQVETGVGDEYYDLQDKIVKEITLLINKIDSTSDRHEILYLLSMLTKEFPDTLEVDKAELGLVSFIKQPGLGLEKGKSDEMKTFLKKYVDKKIALNLKMDKDNVRDILKKNPFDLNNRISTLNRLNKILYSNSYDKVVQNEQDFERKIDDSSLSVEAKAGIKENAKRIKTWKIFEIYRQRIGYSDRAVDSLDKELKDELAGLLQEARRLEKPSDYKQMVKKLNEIEEKVPDQSKNITKEIQAISDLRLEMSLAEKNINSKEKLESVNLPKNEITDLRVIIDNITDTQDYQKLSRGSDELRARISELHPDVAKKLKELLETKFYSLTKKIKEKIKDILKDTVLQDAQKKELLNDIEKLESAKDLEKLSSEAKNVEYSIDKFQSQGFISRKAQESLIKELERIKGFVSTQLEIAGNKPAKELGGKKEIRGTWEELIEMLPLKEEIRDILKKLTEELSKADKIPDIENINQAVERELADLSKGGMKEEAGKLRDAFKQESELKMRSVINKALSSLKEDMGKLKSMDPRASAALEEHLRRVRNSSTKQEFQKRIDALKKYVSSKGSEAKQRKPQDEQVDNRVDPWQIYIMPMRVVIPVGAFIYLKNIAIYNKVFIKELGPELEWFSSDSAVAIVEKGGVVYALSKGSTKISVRYRSKVVEGTEVVVVDKIAGGIDAGIKNYLKE